VRYSTLLTIRTLARRVSYLDAELTELNRTMRPLVELAAPGLLGMHGVGCDVAAKLLVAAGDNHERLTCEAAFAHLCGVAPLEASSGKTRRHRLNRGGNRQANNALYTIVITRMRSHTPDPELRHPPTLRRQVDRRNRPHAQALRRPRSLQTPPPDRQHLNHPQRRV
jgi:transposase